MMNVSPEELRRLQILNDYVAQSLEVAQRLNPYLQPRGAWQPGYLPGVIPQVPFAGAAINPLPFGTPLPRTIYATPANGFYHTTLTPTHPLAEAAYASAFGINPIYSAISPLVRSTFPMASYGPLAYLSGLQHASYEQAFAHPGYAPSAYGYGLFSPVLRTAYGAPAIAPYAYTNGLQHSAYDPAYGIASPALRAAYGMPAIAPWTPIAPIAHASGLQHTGYEPNSLGLAPVAIDPYTAAVAQSAIQVQALIEAQRAEAYRRALIGMPV